MRNLSLFFNKTYYEYLGNVGNDKNIEKIVEYENKCLFDTKFIHDKDYRCCKITGAKSIVMKTKYPGMMIGTGNPHGAGNVLGCDNDIEVGFSFDYVSGQPYIPGSTVKGVIRSYFKKHDVIKAIINQVTEKTLTEAQISALEENIFEGKDVFFDAVIYDSDKNYRILGSEYITPHDSPLKNPIPIHMLKILPGVKFEFRFLVKSFEEDNICISDKEKICIFQSVLEYFGVGAKTNVGYGILEFCNNPSFKSGVQRNEIMVLDYKSILELYSDNDARNSNRRNGGNSR